MRSINRRFTYLLILNKVLRNLHFKNVFHYTAAHVHQSQSPAPRRSRRRRRIFGRAAAAEKFDRRAERRRRRKFWAAPAQIGGGCINTTISVVAVTNRHVLW